MKFIVCSSKAEAIRRGVELVVGEIGRNPELVLGLATGGTMIRFYSELVSFSWEKKISFSKVRTFNLDEYVGLSFRNKESFRYFMEKNFFDKVDLKKENIVFLNGEAKNLDGECERFEKSVKNVGGINLQILGIGKNGHIGFNEPGSSIKSKTRVVDLSLETRKANAKFFGGKFEKVPREALTMGVSTILGAEKIVLFAFGKEKADAVRDAVEDKIGCEVPASLLQRHKNVIFILDKGAASELKKLRNT